MLRWHGLGILLVALSSSSCISGSAIPTGSSRYDAAPASKSIDTYFSGQRPSRSYEEVGIVTAKYRSGTGFSTPDVTDVLPELHAQARELGADGVVITQVLDHPLGGGPHPGYISHPILEVRATAIRYRPYQAPPPTAASTSGFGTETPSRSRTADPQAPLAKPPEFEGSGTGFVVSRTGHVLTNNHVVQDCREVRLRLPPGGSETGSILANDSTNDLALVKLSSPTSTTASFRDDRKVRQGEGVVAVGFPLRSTLALGLNVTAGIVSALVGPGNDSRYLQMTAQIQPGNSGGPLFDVSGNVVGVVAATANVLRVARTTGTFPQNINFAINASVVRTFLEVNGVDFETAAPATASRLEPADIVERAKQFTFVVECWK